MLSYLTFQVTFFVLRESSGAPFKINLSFTNSLVLRKAQDESKKQLAKFTREKNNNKVI